MATEFKLPDLGENIASGDVVSVHVKEGDVIKPGQALLEVDRHLEWATARSRMLPMLPRRQAPWFPPETTPIRITVPPGIPVMVAVDIGPAWILLTREVTDEWALDDGILVAHALENLRSRLSQVGPEDLQQERLADLPVRILRTGLDCASGLLLVPDELPRILGPGPQCLIAPMRDLLISLPADADRAIVGELNDALATADPRGLALDAFLFDGGALRYETLTAAGAPR